MREKVIKSMGHVYANYFSKTYIVYYRKMPKIKQDLSQAQDSSPDSSLFIT